MYSLTSDLADLLLNFIKDSRKTEDDKLRVSQEYELESNDFNSDIAVDAARYLLFNRGIYQLRDLLNDLPKNAGDKFQLAAYDGVLKLLNFVLLPAPFPLKHYQRCCTCSTVLTEVVDQMSVDLELLNELFAPIVKYDKFVRDLLDISNEVYGPGGRVICDDIRTHVSRSDYFIHLEDLNRDRNTNDSDVGRNNGRNNSDGSGSTSTHLEFCRFCHYDHCLCQFALTSNSQDHPEFKLVEINLGGCSLSHYSGVLYKVHDKILRTSLVDTKESDPESMRKLAQELKKVHMLNEPNTSFTYPISESHKLYLKRYTPIFGEKRVCVLLIADAPFYNYFDTYFISNDLFNKYGIIVKTAQVDIMVEWMNKRKLFLVSEWEYNTDCSVKVTKYTHYPDKLRPGRLVLNLDTEPTNFNKLNKLKCYEITTIYSRDFYDSIEMVTDESVLLRTLLEFSDACKIPNSLFQLVNTKRAQMYFSQPENVDRLLSSYNKRVKGIKRNTGLVDLVKQSAVLQVDPSLESNADVVNDAIENPEKYVMKPNREIGRGLLFNEELSNILKECQNNKEELSQYVLMRKILVPKQPGLFVKHLRNGAFEVKGHNSLTELGVYHYALYDGNECKLNETNGYLARTKPDFATGGGISAGHGYINTLLLF